MTPINENRVTVSELRMAAILATLGTPLIGHAWVVSTVLIEEGKIDTRWNFQKETPCVGGAVPTGILCAAIERKKDFADVKPEDEILSGADVRAAWPFALAVALGDLYRRGNPNQTMRELFPVGFNVDTINADHLADEELVKDEPSRSRLLSLWPEVVRQYFGVSVINASKLLPPKSRTKLVCAPMRGGHVYAPEFSFTDKYSSLAKI